MTSRTGSRPPPIVSVLLLGLLSCLQAAPSPPHMATPLGATRACFEGAAATLAGDAMGGRGVGTAGLERAARFIEAQYRRLGLRPVGGTHRQRFRVVTGVKLGPGNRLSWEGGRAELSRDFVPLGFSSSGAFEGPLLFAGYGLRAEVLGYDDYEGVDVSGRVVLAMRYEPQEDDPDSRFDGRRPTPWSDLRYKAHAAREAGAAALLLVEPHPEDADRLPVLKQEGPIARAGLPVLQVRREVAEGWLSRAGIDLASVRNAIDSSLEPHTIQIPSVFVRGEADVVPTEAQVANLVGLVPGRGDLAEQAIVVGAHYDHLGVREHGSLQTGEVAIHNGADDNASGVAAMLCALGDLVPRLRERDDDRRTLVAVAFAAEEIGLGGSAWYVRNPPVPIEDTVAMVNLDMVGRLREDRLSALGADSSPAWAEILEAAATSQQLDLRAEGDGYGPSDQTSFYEKEVPVVHLFTGAHEEYHTPSDDAGTLNMDGGARVAAFLRDVLGRLVVFEEPLPYVASSGGPRMTGDSRGYGSYLGTIPDYTRMGQGDDGVLLMDVRGAGPADAAGLRGGDRIVRMAGVDVRNLYDMTFVLRDHRPGETIEIEFVRGGERSRVRATLGHRDRARGSPPETGDAPTPPDPVWTPSAGREADHLLDPREKRLADLRQLTFGGENAEAYFSPDGRRLVFQRTPPQGGCDQMYLLDLDSGGIERLSSGRGRTTCGYFAYPDGDRVIYSTTEGDSAECPPPPDRSQGYVWPLDEYDLVWQREPGASPEPFLAAPGYDAEATVCPVDGRIVFTSTRDGDLDLYIASPDGSDVRRVTDTPGYDGGAFFTSDCSALVWRASRPTGEELEEYRRLLDRRLVRPSRLEILWMDLASHEVRQLTRSGRASFAPFPHPDGASVLYSSNLAGGEREFDLYRVGSTGGEPERITFAPGFDGFPVFSPDGKWLVFASNRAGGGSDTDLFIARWIP